MQVIDLIYIAFFTVMVFSSLLWLLVYISNRDEVYKNVGAEDQKSVTFLVPAYNEENHIEDTIEALFNQNYPNDKVDIIAINDGSTDRTLERLKKYSDRITVLDKENTGKASSLNYALPHVDTELVACMDADSRPEPDFLNKMVGYFSDNVTGVTPALKLKRDSTWIEKIQWTEYMFQIFLRKIFAIFNVQYVLPGPGSLYRTDYLKETGGWDEETYTEDMEIAFRMFSDGKQLQNSANAYTYTDPPSTLRKLIRQRTRWYAGYLENFLQYKELFANPSHGNLGLFLLPLNVIWIVIVTFFFGHNIYNFLSTAIDWGSTYTLLGYIPLEFTFSMQNIHLFHIFIGFFLLLGVGMILISLRTAGEDIRPWTRKVHYATFFALYPFLFALFWLAALVETVLPGDGSEW